MTWRLVIILWLGSFMTFAQNGIPIGTWRTHFSFRDAHSLALTNQGIYCAGGNSLFLLAFDDNSITPLSKIDGLSRADLSTLGFDETNETLIIAYDQGTLDLLQNGELTEITSIANADNTLPKQINHINAENGIAFVSGAFGIARLNIDRKEIQEAYVNIASDGDLLNVQATTILNDSIFAASDEGVIAGSLNPQVNLLDFTNWRRFGSIDGIISAAFQAIATFNNRVYAARSMDGVYVYEGGIWQRLDYDLTGVVLSAVSSDLGVVITTSNGIIQIDLQNNVQMVDAPQAPKPQWAVEGSGNLWIADSLNGLVRQGVSGVYPGGPYSDSLVHLNFINEQIVAFPPGFDRFRLPLNTRLGFNWFLDNSWTAFNDSGEERTEPLPSIPNIISGTHNGEKFYFASFGSGILEWDQSGTAQLLDDSSPGSTLIRSSLDQVLISSIVADAQGRIWCTNYGNSLILHQYDPTTSTWQAFTTPFIAARFPLDIQETEQGDLWLRLDPNNGGGIWVINPESGIQKLLTTVQGQGGLPTSQINDLEIDLEGQVWLATQEGVAVYPFPFDILERAEVNSSLVFIDGRPLLRDEKVTAIAIDGGNRKWMGTDSGVWLFSALGDSVVFNFTEDNSPLPSNFIVDIAIDPNSGEVFILTDLGLVSFRSTATTGTRSHQQVKIFPNPVDASFNGLVGISGLTTNAILKITDVTGNLVTELRAEGGTATWNVADYRGQRVRAGVYLVFSSSSDGQETFVGKIAVFN